jgi:hypothetical protein
MTGARSRFPQLYVSLGAVALGQMQNTLDPITLVLHAHTLVVFLYHLRKLAAHCSEYSQRFDSLFVGLRLVHEGRETADVSENRRCLYALVVADAQIFEFDPDVRIAVLDFVERDGVAILFNPAAAFGYRALAAPSYFKARGGVRTIETMYTGKHG